MFAESAGLQYGGIGYFVTLGQAGDFENVGHAFPRLKIGEPASANLIASIRAFACGPAREALNSTTREVKFFASFAEPVPGVRHHYYSRRDRIDGEGCSSRIPSLFSILRGVTHYENSGLARAKLAAIREAGPLDSASLAPNLLSWCDDSLVLTVLSHGATSGDPENNQRSIVDDIQRKEHCQEISSRSRADGQNAVPRNSIIPCDQI